MNEVMRWDFPLPRTHCGMLQGNGCLGAMIWGQDNTLKITLNRADFWDHRGGLPWSDRINFRTIRARLEAGKHEELRALFEPPDVAVGQPRRPSLLPLGRLELVWHERLLKTGYLHLRNGKVVIDVGNGSAASHQIAFHMAMDKPLLNIHFPPGKDMPSVNRVPSWELLGDKLEALSFEKPELFDEGALGGWTQTRPSDPAVCLAYMVTGNDIWITVAYGKKPLSARQEAKRILDTAVEQGHDALRAATAQWWADYWRRVPQVELPNEGLSSLYYYGMYKFAGLTNPAGVPAGLQGAWVEEYQMPPWSADYHFNINVQMCYWPAYRANLTDHLNPLFAMIGSWEKTLRDNARKFVGIDDGLIMPHAVDDRCTGMGGFWTGAIDHGCTAWVAEMMYRKYLYTQDLAFLRKTAYSFMKGAMRVYEEMLESDGESMWLPVSVSPEYRGAGPNAWGRNASFQLACVHFLCESLIEVSKVLGIEPEERWLAIRSKLPRAGLCDSAGPGGGGAREIGIWDNVPLEESHRHHSHLAGITPFDTIDLDDPEWQPILERSIVNWIACGMGKWSGWCVPWASMIHTRFRNADTAELLLDIWQRLFTNEGHGTLHDPAFPGISMLGQGATRMAKGEIMQMDAGMAATAAIMEMLIHTRRGVNYLFWGAPARWRQVSFESIRTEGAFEVSAARVQGRVARVSVRANSPGTFRLSNPWNGRAVVQRPSGATQIQGSVLEIPMTPHERIEITAE